MIPKNESALAGSNRSLIDPDFRERSLTKHRLVKDRSRKSGSIQERSFIKLAPDLFQVYGSHAAFQFGGWVCLLVCITLQIFFLLTL